MQCSRALTHRGISVDNFAGGSRWYFLTHTHTDHMSGLEPVRERVIYASEESCRFVTKKYPHVTAIPLKTRVDYVFGDGEFKVRLIPCNHCIGSVMILIDDTHLFTGDFRYSREWYDKEVAPVLAKKKLKAVYLDNTYEHIPDLPTWSETVQELSRRKGPVLITDPTFNSAPLWPLLKGGVWVGRGLKKYPMWHPKLPGVVHVKSKARYHVTDKPGGIQLTSNWFVCQRDYEPIPERICFSTHSSANEFNEFRQRVDPRGALEWVSCTDSARLVCPQPLR